MADFVTLPAQKRTVMRKKTKQLRRNGITPIAVYGHRTEPAALQVDSRELARVLSTAGLSKLIAIEVEGEDEPRICLARAAQRHVTKHNVIHADFLQVSMDETVRSEVTLHVLGEPEAVRANEARLDVLLNLVSVEALPNDLPPSLQVDASGLEEIGDTITIADLDIGEGVSILNDGDEVIARLSALRLVVLEEEVPAEGEELLEEGEEAAEGTEAASGTGTREPSDDAGESGDA
jgi:large subunit ribosomal protein L25